MQKTKVDPLPPPGREMRSVTRFDTCREPNTVPARIAAVALGLCGVALLSGRAVFAVVLMVGVLATLFSPGNGEPTRIFRRVVFSPQVMTAAAVLAAWIPSTALSYLPWESVQVLARMALFLFVGLWIYAYFGERQGALDLLLKVFFVGLAFGVLVADLGVWGFPELLVLIKGRGASSTVQAALMVKGFASAAIVFVPFVAWAGWRLGGPWKGLSLALAAALLVLTALAGSRAGMAGMIGAMVVALIACVAHGRSRRWASGLVVVIIIAVGGIIVYLSGRPYGGSVPEELLLFPPWLIDPHRQVIWQYTLELAAQRPWIGWGINTINMIPQMPGTSSVIFGVPVLPSHPHNWIIEIFSETGIIGGIPMLIAIALQFFTMLRRYRATGEAKILAALAASAAFWISGLFNFSFWSAWWQVSFVLVLALLYADRPASSVPRGLPQSAERTALSTTP